MKNKPSAVSRQPLADDKLTANRYSLIVNLLAHRVSRFFILHSLLFILLLTGCSGQYKGIPREQVLTYHTRPTYGSLYDLAAAYATSLNDAIKHDTLHPGMYADLGITLHLMGHTEEGCRMLNAEMKAFPESKPMVTRIKQQLMPHMLQNDFATIGDTAPQIKQWAYDSLTSLRPFPFVASIIDSTDTAWIHQQTPTDSVFIPIRFTANQKREMLAARQAEEALQRQAKIDSVAAAKQAKIDARNKAKKDKEKAKKVKEKEKKAKEKAKKRAEKEKKALRKQQEAARAAQRRQDAAVKEELKRQQAAERESQRKQQKEKRKEAQDEKK